MTDVVLIARCPEHGLHGQRDTCFECGGPVEQVAMVPAATTSDPRPLGGDIAGPGGPHDRGQVILDTRNSVLLAEVEVAMVDNASDQRRFASLVLGGRINRSTDQSRVLYLFDADGAAAIVTELIGLAGREGDTYAAEFKAAVSGRLERMP